MNARPIRRPPLQPSRDSPSYHFGVHRTGVSLEEFHSPRHGKKKFERGAIGRRIIASPSLSCPGDNRIDCILRRFQSPLHPAMAVGTMLPGKIDSTLWLNDMLVDACELAWLIKSKCPAAPPITVPSPACPFEDHAALPELGMHL